MKILVIDDNPLNLASAQQTFKDHEVTTCLGADQADELLDMRGRYHPEDSGEFNYDVVLCDMLMPAQQRGGHNDNLAGQEMVLGWAFALRAAQLGAKYVAMVSDKNHHDHPASALIDGLGGIMNVNGAKVLFTNSDGKTFIDGTICSICSGKAAGRGGRDPEYCHTCYDFGLGVSTGKAWGKEWGWVFKWLTEKR